MNKKEFGKKIEEIVAESKAEVTITSSGTGCSCSLHGRFNPINALGMLSAAIKSLAGAIHLEPEELLEMYHRSVNIVVGSDRTEGIDLVAVVDYLAEIREKENKDE